ncbi:MAG TPA: monooxygenase [Terriglobales bacterium]|nr:monooxygenase [Terriglobales bacterium]
MTLLQIDFPHPGPFGNELTAACTGLAQSIAAESGMLWKIWTENKQAGEAGGIYLFTDEASARKYLAMHEARLAGMGIKNIRAKVFDVNETLSRMTNAPLFAVKTAAQ